MWACNLCKKKQEILAKTGQWYHGGMARPVGLDVETLSGSETTSTKTDPSPPNEKRQKFGDKSESGHTSSEKENIEKTDSRDRAPMSRQGSQLKRQYSLDAQRGKLGESSVNNKDQSDRLGSKEQDKIRTRGNNVPTERGRNRDKSPARHRYHSESRLTETDKRIIAHERGGDNDRFGGRSPREALGSRTDENRENREKGRHSDERDGRRGHERDRKEGPERNHPEKDIIKKESSARDRTR